MNKTFFHHGRVLLLASAILCSQWLAPVSLLAGVEQTVESSAKVRADFLKIIDRPRVAPEPEIKLSSESNGVSQFHFSFATDASQRVPGILLKSSSGSGKRPVVIALHGTGGTKESQAGLLRLLVHKGFIGVAIDGRYHGERSKAGKGTADYTAAIAQAFKDGKSHPFYYDTVWDMMRLIDYLETRDDVDPTRIGLIGFSKGGIETYLTAAVDTRIAVAVPCIGVQSFAWALENNSWNARIATIQGAFNTVAKEAGNTAPDSAFVQKFYDRVVPGIYSEFDGPAMVTCITPRPLMSINGDSDDKTPIPGLNLCLESARKSYAAAHVPEKFTYIIQEKTGHKVNDPARDKAIEWFEKWLK
jgi:dienelactone hydrolase